MTIALQGEWGSGKTSLMYKLQEELCNTATGEYESVWVNTWEYSMMSTPEETVYNIILRLVEQLTKNDTDSNAQGKKLVRNMKRVGYRAMRELLKTLPGVGVAVEAAGMATELPETEEHETTTLTQLKLILDAAVKKTMAEQGKKGVIVFVDDLDRLNPPVAVEILELLKNIFTLKGCIFILAIDYDVVVKGLEPKFGKRTAKNEREFRSFFDKIIQVPFSMPVANYQPLDFLSRSLVNIDYIRNDECRDKLFMDSLMSVVQKTVGNNPRSLIRLMNILSLIKCIYIARDSQSEGEFDLNHRGGKFLNFAVAAIQVQYPKIFSMLTFSPDFTHWDNETVAQMNIAPESAEMLEVLKQVDKFNEPWEKALFMVCVEDEFLNSRFREILSLMNLIRKNVESNIKLLNSVDIESKVSQLTLASVMRDSIQMSSVTSVSASDDTPVVMDWDAWHDMVYKFHNGVEDRLRSRHPNWEFTKRRNTGNGGFNVSEPCDVTIPFYNQSEDGKFFKMYFEVLNSYWNEEHLTKEPYVGAHASVVRKSETLAEIFKDLDSFMSNVMSQNDWIEWNSIHDFHMDDSNFDENRVMQMLPFSFHFQTIEDFTTQSHLDVMARIIEKMIDTDTKFWRLFDANYKG